MLLVMLPLALAGLVFTVALLTVTFQYYGKSAEKAQSEPIRDFMIAEINEGMADAPVDAKSGDIYFPEFRMYLPRPAQRDEQLRLKYTFFSDGSGPAKEFHVTDRKVLSRLSNGLRSAPNLNTVWDTVPHLQACASGLTVSEQRHDEPSGPELKHVVKLDDGRTVYIYLDQTCTELTTLTDRLANLKSY
jgi:hypothetical protein